MHPAFCEDHASFQTGFWKRTQERLFQARASWRHRKGHGPGKELFPEATPCLHEWEQTRSPKLKKQF